MFCYCKQLCNILEIPMLSEVTSTVNDLLNVRGIYLILVLKGGASNRYEAFFGRGCLFLI